ncbi:MAG: DUF1993 domain-containing protein [Pseudomonadota bacterium]
MSISMYAASVGVYTRVLTNLATILDKAAAYAEERKIEPAALLHARLAPDMHHLVRQVQICTDMVKGTVARLAGVEPPKYEDNEATFADVKARVAKTLDYIKSFKPEQFEGAESRAITIKLPHRQLDFVGTDYLLGFGTPNVYFHYTTVYALLRNNGLAIGKGDYLA